MYGRCAGCLLPQNRENRPTKLDTEMKAEVRQKIMFAAGVCARVVTGIYFFPPKSNVDHEFFIHNILKPIVEKYIPRLYAGEESRVVLPFDSAPGHTTKKSMSGSTHKK